MLDIPEDFEKKLRDAISILQGHDKFRIITHYDADGITSSAVLARCLMKYQKGFHATFVNSFPDDIPQGYPIIFTDIGNGHLSRINQLDEPAIVLDHHDIKDAEAEVAEDEDHVFVNPYDYGIDGSQEISGGTLTLLLTVLYDSTNWEESIYGLAGASADKQAIGGFRGMNLKLVEEALEKDHLEKSEDLFIDGRTVYSALMKACDPYFPGISGEEEEIKKILNDIEIDLEAKLESISPDKKRKLNSILVLSLLEKDIPAHVIESMYGTHYISPKSGIDADVLYKLLNSCARNGRSGLGLSLCLGDNSAFQEAKRIRDSYRKQMIQKLKKLDEKIETKENIQYFYEEKRTRKGELAGLGMLYLLEQDRPVLGLSELEENVDISARATKQMVDAGLDLGKLCSLLAEKLGGEGGGHNIAAGATVEKNKIDDFLDMMDEEVGKELKRAK